MAFRPGKSRPGPDKKYLHRARIGPGAEIIFIKNTSLGYFVLNARVPPVHLGNRLYPALRAGRDYLLGSDRTRERRAASFVFVMERRGSFSAVSLPPALPPPTTRRDLAEGVQINDTSSVKSRTATRKKGAAWPSSLSLSRQFSSGRDD